MTQSYFDDISDDDLSSAFDTSSYAPGEYTPAAPEQSTGYFDDLEDEDLYEAFAMDLVSSDDETVDEQPEEEPDAVWTDYVYSLMSGAAGVGELAFDAAGWALDKVGAESVGDAVKSVGDGSVDYWRDQYSEGGKADMAKPFVKKNEDSWLGYELAEGAKDIDKIAMMGIESLPATGLGMGIGAAVTKGAQVLANPVFRKALEKAAAKGPVQFRKTASRIDKVNAGIGVAGFAAGEGLVGGAFTAKDVYDRVIDMPHEQLMEHPEYQRVFSMTDLGEASGPMEERIAHAKERLAEIAAQRAGLGAGGATAALGGPMGAVFGKSMGRVGLNLDQPGWLARVLGGGAGEAAQEGTQSAAETIIANTAIADYADRDQDPYEGLAENIVGGTLAGAGMGAVFGMAQGSGSQAPPAADGKQKIKLDPGPNAPPKDQLYQELRRYQTQFTQEERQELSPLLQQVRDSHDAEEVTQEYLDDIRYVLDNRALPESYGSAESEQAALPAPESNDDGPEEPPAAGAGTGPAAVDPAILSKAQETFDKHGMNRRQAEAIEDALRQKEGDEQANAFISEYDRLADEAVAARQQQKAAEVDAAPAPESNAPVVGSPEVAPAPKMRGPLRDLAFKVTNAAGTERNGRKLANDYGEVEGVTGADGGPLGAFYGPDADNPMRPVFVVDQIDRETGDFSEHKVMVGFKTEAEARAAYVANYGDDDGVGAITQMPQKNFVAWTKGPNTTQALSAELRRGVKPASQFREVSQPETGNVRLGDVNVSIDSLGETSEGFVRGAGRETGQSIPASFGPSTGVRQSGVVYVANEVDSDGNFTGHRVYMGYDSRSQALDASRSRPLKTDGVRAMSPGQFRQWVASASKSQPVEGNQSPASMLNDEEYQAQVIEPIEQAIADLKKKHDASRTHGRKGPSYEEELSYLESLLQDAQGDRQRQPTSPQLEEAFDGGQAEEQGSDTGADSVRGQEAGPEETQAPDGEGAQDELIDAPDLQETLARMREIADAEEAAFQGAMRDNLAAEDAAAGILPRVIKNKWALFASKEDAMLYAKAYGIDQADVFQLEKFEDGYLIRYKLREANDTFLTFRDPGQYITLSERDRIWARWRHAPFYVRDNFAQQASQGVILSLFDRTGNWSRPYVEAGYQVVQIDIDHPIWNIDINTLDADEMLNFGWDDVQGILAAPPCQHFSAAGIRFWGEKDIDGRTIDGLRLLSTTQELIGGLAPGWHVIENPSRGRMNKPDQFGGNLQDSDIEPTTQMGQPRTVFEPYHHGDNYTKQTALWGDFVHGMPRANVFPGVGSLAHKLTGFTKKQKQDRSDTPLGFSYAFFLANGPLSPQSVDFNEWTTAWEWGAAIHDNGLGYASSMDVFRELANAGYTPEFLESLDMFEMEGSDALLELAGPLETLEAVRSRAEELGLQQPNPNQRRIDQLEAYLAELESGAEFSPSEEWKAKQVASTRREIEELGGGQPLLETYSEADLEARAQEGVEPEIQEDVSPDTGAAGDLFSQGEQTDEMFPGTSLPGERAAAQFPENMQETVRHLQKSGIEAVDPTTLETDAETFQYKAGGDQQGVLDTLKSVQEWDDNKAGAIMVYEYADGRRVVADGHQRVGLANRLKPEGGIRIMAKVMREADGFTPADVRRIAAETNIAQGSGTAVDAAKVLRELTPEAQADILKKIPVTASIVRDAIGLAKLGENAFMNVVNEQIKPTFAAMVGQRFADPQEQDAAIQMLIRTKPASIDQVSAMLEDMAAAGFNASEQGGLFGDSQLESLIVERSKILAQALAGARKDKSLFNTLVGDKAKIEQAGNRLDKQTNQQMLEQTQELLATLIKSVNTSPQLNGALNELSNKVKTGDVTVAQAAREFLNFARENQEGSGGTRNAEPGAEEQRPGLTWLHPETARLAREAAHSSQSEAVLMAAVQNRINALLEIGLRPDGGSVAEQALDALDDLSDAAGFYLNEDTRPAERPRLRQALLDALGGEPDPNTPVPGDLQPRLESRAPARADSLSAADLDAALRGFGLDMTGVTVVQSAADLPKISGLERFMTVWHGSPRWFPQFSIEAVGTSTGVSAFGFGLYFSDAQPVARSYMPGRLTKENLDALQRRIGELRAELRAESGDFSRALAVSQQVVALENYLEQHTPTLYRVNLNDAATEAMLLWDESLANQGEAVQQIMALLPDSMLSIIGLTRADLSSDMTAGQMYRKVANELGGMREASEYLNGIGIPGVIYTDARSRFSKNQNATNYVVFDPSVVQIEDAARGLRSEADEQIEGLYDPVTGEIYLVADQVGSVARARWVLWHEKWHRGARVAYANEFDSILDEASQNTVVSNLADAIIADRGLDPQADRLLAVEEALAELNAAMRSGRPQDIATRYGVSVPAGMQSGWRGAVSRAFQRLRALLSRMLGRPITTDAEVYDIITGASMSATSAEGAMAEMLMSQGFSKDVFFSALERTIRIGKDAPKKAVSASSWKQWLDGQQKRGEFKTYEREWIGLDAWLDGLERKVSLEEIQAFMEVNSPKLQTILLGVEDSADGMAWTESLVPEYEASKERALAALEGWRKAGLSFSDIEKVLIEELAKTENAYAANRLPRWFDQRIENAQNKLQVYQGLMERIKQEIGSSTADISAGAHVAHLLSILEELDPQFEFIGEVRIAETGETVVVTVSIEPSGRTMADYTLQIEGYPDVQFYNPAETDPVLIEGVIDSPLRKALGIEDAEVTGPVPDDFAEYQRWSIFKDDPLSYRELIMHWENGGQQKTAGDDRGNVHWGSTSKAPIFHIRFGEVVDGQGRRVMLVEEMQGDWPAWVRDQGLENVSEEMDSLLSSELFANEEILRNAWEYFEVTGTENPEADRLMEEGVQSVPDLISLARLIASGNLRVRLLEEVDEQRDIFDMLENVEKALALPPAYADWHTAAFKRAVRYAAENGFDRIAIAAGESQANIYGQLSLTTPEIDLSADGKRIIYRESWRHENEEYDIESGAAAKKIGESEVARAVAAELGSAQAQDAINKARESLTGLTITMGQRDEPESYEIFYAEIAQNLEEMKSKLFKAEMYRDTESVFAAIEYADMLINETRSDRPVPPELAEAAHLEVSRVGQEVMGALDLLTKSMRAKEPEMRVVTGGEKLRALYNNVHPNKANKWLKQFGVRLQRELLPAPAGYARIELGELEYLGQDVNHANALVPGVTEGGIMGVAVDITNDMREAARGGFPLFSTKPKPKPAVSRTITGNLLPDEKANLKRWGADELEKLIDLFGKMPTTQEMAAIAKAGSAKRGWYENSTAAIVDMFGPDAPRFAALLAALSPLNTVEQNLMNALNTWANWNAAGRPTGATAILRIMAKSVAGNGTMKSVLPAWRNNSIRALSAANPESIVLSGPKVQSFALNLRGMVNEVTQDAWMAMYTAFDQNLFSGALTKSGPGKGPGYLAASARTRAAAKYLTRLTGDEWTPAEVQETIWSWTKALLEMSASKGETRRPIDIIMDGDLTDDRIADTPAFMELFNDPQIKAILLRGGYIQSARESAFAAANRGAERAARLGNAPEPQPVQKARATVSEAEQVHLRRAAKRAEAAAKLRAEQKQQAKAIKAANKLKAAQAKERRALKSTAPKRPRPAWMRPESSRLNTMKKFLEREFASGGLLPDVAYQAQEERDGLFNENDLVVERMVRSLEKEAKRQYGVAWRNLSEQQLAEVSQYLKGENDGANVPQSVRDVLDELRAYIDGLTQAIIESGIYEPYVTRWRIVSDGQVVAEDIPTKAEAERAMKSMGALIDAQLESYETESVLFDKMMQNIGSYLNRSYQAFDDPDWPRKVPDEVREDAFNFIMSEWITMGYVDELALQGLSEEEIEARVAGVVNRILEDGTAAENIGAFISQSRLGSKDLSMLIKRKDIAAPIRRLLGEYTDPRLNFARTATKMSRALHNHIFAQQVLLHGRGAFLFREPVGQFSVPIAPEGSASMAPLDGWYTTPEIRDAFKDAVSADALDGMWRFVVGLNGLVKYGKTVLSPITISRNFLSAFFFGLSNGHFNVLRPSKHILPAKTVVAEILRSGGDASYIRELMRLGVIMDNPYAGEMIALIKDVAREGVPLTGFKGAVKKGMDFMTRIYQAGDDYWKIIGYEQERRLLEKYHQMTEADAKVEAAKRIRNNYPTYSKVGKRIKWLRRFPLAGTFVSFPAEIVRTTKNQILTIASDFSDPATRPMALQKALGISLAASSAVMLGELAKILFGLDIDDEDEEGVRKLGKPWEANSNLIFLPPDEKGSIRYIDFSYFDPYNYLKRPVTAMLNGSRRTGENAVSALTDLGMPFLGTDIAAQAMMEVWANSKADTRRPVYNEAADPIDQVADIANHLRKALQPGAAAWMERLYRASNDEVTWGGTVMSEQNELLSLTGARITTFQPDTAIKGLSLSFVDGKSSATQLLSRPLMDQNPKTEAEIEEAFNDMMRARERVYRDMIDYTRTALAFGETAPHLRDIMKAMRVSEADRRSLLSGEIPEWRLSSSFLESAKKGALASAKTPEERRTIALEFANRRRIVMRLRNEYYAD